jgi:uncharacterized coiled-coil DUF342 family protein
MTYTQEQIDALRKKYAYLIRAVEKYGTKRRALAAGNPVTGEGGPDLSEEEIDVALLLSALSTAEQERDENEGKGKELCVLSVNLMMERDEANAKADQYKNDWYAAKTEFGDITAKLRDRVRTAEARCAELEARLQGAADRAVEWCNKWDGYDIYQPDSGESLRAAILGEKKED